MTAGEDPRVPERVERQPAGSDAPGPPSKSRAELVHDARKAIKRMRALARLLRCALGEREFERVDDSLRAAGRRLSGARDAEVRLATLRRLRSKHPKALASPAIERLHEQLERERSQADEPAGAQEALADVASMRAQLARWNVARHNFDALAPGLRRIYRQGRRRHARVRAGAPTPEELHNWRKRVKALYYALDMLGATQAKGARGATRRARRLGEALGEEHDLWMLLAYVHEHPQPLGGDRVALEALSRTVERRRKRLRKRALRIGARLYERKPAGFTRRIGAALDR